MRVRRVHGADHYTRFNERRFFRRFIFRDERSLSLQSSSTPVQDTGQAGRQSHDVVLILTRENPPGPLGTKVFGAARCRAPPCLFRLETLEIDGGRWVEGCGGRERRGMEVHS
jgi:hypothetical protein